MITIQPKGFKELKAKFDKLKQDAQTELDGIMRRGADTFVRNAQKESIYQAQRQQITKFPAAPLSYTVVSGWRFSPYFEWGTITRVDVPGELTEYAAQFKGRGIRKTGGIYPRPFFFKQSGPVQAQLETDIKNFLNGVDL